MKAFYSLWPNYEYIDKLIGSGIDTLLVTAHDLPWDIPSNYYDNKATVIETIARYKSRCRILLVPLWVRPWANIMDTQRWEVGGGRTLKGTPCPMSHGYIRSRVKEAVAFAKEHGCGGIIWDLEHLEYQSRPDVIPFYHSLWGPEHRCNCIVCQQYKSEDLWKAHAGIVRNELDQSGLPVHGQMPYSGGWTMRQYPGDLYHFTQETYKRDVGWLERFKWERSYRKENVSPRVIPGIWCEFKQSEDALIRYIKQIYYKYDHFWLYSHEFFGNKIPNPHVGYPMKGPATDWFFEELKKI